MSDLLDNVNALIGRVFRGPAFSKVLLRVGIEPKRYWLLMDLFHKLSTRQEMQGQMGRQLHVLRVSALIFVVLSFFAALGFLVFGGSAFTLGGVMLGLLMFTLSAVLLSEAANSLVNPEEALALAHQPINGATYSGAKLSHLLQIVVHYVLGWTLLPALVMPLLPNGRWFYPLAYVFTALLVGILLGLFCCSLYGLLMRVVPPRRIKSAAQLIQAIPPVLIGFFQFSPKGTAARLYHLASDTAAPVIALPIWLLVLSASLLTIAVTVTGLRALSGDYLIRVSSMVHGRADAGTKIRRSILGDIVRRLFGGQAGRAGFDYVKRMIMRDWQFRRQLLEWAPMLFFISVGLFTGGLLSPFSSGWSSTHFIPHAIGFILLAVCAMMPYGTDHKGIWLFLLVSDRGLERFAQGVHASLWLVFIAVPYTALFPFLVWKWGVSDAVIFSLFAASTSSIYLALGLRTIEGIPFGKQASPGQTRSGKAFVRIILFIVGAGTGVGVQYLLYRSVLAVWIATFVLAAVVYVLTRKCLHDFYVAMTYHLSIASATSTMIYKEVGEEGN